MNAAREIGEFLREQPLDLDEAREALVDAHRQLDVLEADALQLMHERDRAQADLAEKQAAIAELRRRVADWQRKDDWGKRGAYRNVGVYLDKHLGTAS